MIPEVECDHLIGEEQGYDSMIWSKSESATGEGPKFITRWFNFCPRCGTKLEVPKGEKTV